MDENSRLQEIPSLSIADDTDYEFDEIQKYKLFWPFDKLILLIRLIFTRLFRSSQKKDSFSFECCTICCQEYPIKRLIGCSSNHLVCGKCIRKIARNSSFLQPFDKIIQGFPCPMYKCQNYFAYENILSKLQRRTRKIIQTKIYEKMLNNAGIDFEKCRKCDYLAEMPPKRFVNELRVFCCPHCFHTFCCKCERKCNKSHFGIKCRKISNETTEKLTQALIHRCYKCYLPFVKKMGFDEGCNIMTCKCGAKQCYACRSPVTSSHKCSKIYDTAVNIHNRDLQKAVGFNKF